MRKTTVLVLASSILTASMALAATSETILDNNSTAAATTGTSTETTAGTPTETTTAAPAPAITQPLADTSKPAAPTTENPATNTVNTATPTTKTITLYTAPDTKASVAAKATASSDLIPIFYPPNSTWVKVADPSNGNVGWVEIDTLKRLDLWPTAQGMMQRKVITTTTEQSTNGPIYKVVEYSSGPQKLTPAQANALIAKVQAQQEQVNAAFQSSMQSMLNQMHQLTNESFSYFPMMQPIIVVPVAAEAAPAVQTVATGTGEDTAQKSSWWQQFKAKFNSEPAAISASAESSKS